MNHVAPIIDVIHVCTVLSLVEKFGVCRTTNELLLWDQFSRFFQTILSVFNLSSEQDYYPNYPTPLYPIVLLISTCKLLEPCDSAVNSWLFHVSFHAQVLVTPVGRLPRFRRGTSRDQLGPRDHMELPRPQRCPATACPTVRAAPSVRVPGDRSAIVPRFGKLWNIVESMGGIQTQCVTSVHFTITRLPAQDPNTTCEFAGYFSSIKG